VLQGFTGTRLAFIGVFSICVIALIRTCKILTSLFFLMELSALDHKSCQGKEGWQ